MDLPPNKIREKNDVRVVTPFLIFVQIPVRHKDQSFTLIYAQRSVGKKKKKKKICIHSIKILSYISELIFKQAVHLQFHNNV